MSLYLPYMIRYNMVMLRTNISQQITKPGNKKNKKKQEDWDAISTLWR